MAQDGSRSLSQRRLTDCDGPAASTGGPGPEMPPERSSRLDLARAGAGRNQYGAAIASARVSVGCDAPTPALLAAILAGWRTLDAPAPAVRRGRPCPRPKTQTPRPLQTASRGRGGWGYPPLRALVSLSLSLPGV